jgi:HSP20 family protein
VPFTLVKEGAQMSKVTVQAADTAGEMVPNGGSIIDEIRKRFGDVRRRAHEFFENRQQHGSALEDWVRAEREILGSPPAELRETGGAYQAEVTLPGFDAADVSVTVAPDQIVVYASREDQQSGQDTNILWTEFGSREVYRLLPTPAAIDTQRTTATLEKGILRIVAPKAVAQSAPVARAANTG